MLQIVAATPNRLSIKDRRKLRARLQRALSVPEPGIPFGRPLQPVKITRNPFHTKRITCHVSRSGTLS